jgi:hypothetical protein
VAPGDHHRSTGLRGRGRRAHPPRAGRRALGDQRRQEDDDLPRPPLQHGHPEGQAADDRDGDRDDDHDRPDRDDADDDHADDDDADHDDADHDGEPRRRRSPRTVLFAALVALAGAGIAAVALFGYLNSGRYILTCEPERAVPEQGRGFPPWGTRALAGAAWRPLKIAPETRCRPQETDDPLVLERVFLAMVLDQATALLTAHEVPRVDDAEALLQQALLLTRPAELESEPLARQRGEQHQEIERLLGDVAYWRGQAKVRDAAGALGDAAKQFDTAAARNPRHATDAAAWAAYARTLAQELHAGSAAPAALAGPAAAPPRPAPSPSPPPAPATPGPAEHAGVPADVALPVEPGKATAGAPAQAAPPPDAGRPTGGVLL